MLLTGRMQLVRDTDSVLLSELVALLTDVALAKVGAVTASGPRLSGQWCVVLVESFASSFMPCRLSLGTILQLLIA